MNIAIIDDTAKWRTDAKERVTAFFNEQPYVEKTNITLYKSGADFLTADKPYDFILLDVEMPILDGFEVARQYQVRHKHCIIIFLSTHDELGRMGYRVNAFRYIDKSNIDEELAEALASVWEVLHKTHCIYLRLIDDVNRSFMTGDIYFMKSDRHYITIYTTHGQFITKTPLQELEKQLAGYGFFRTHKSCLVNLEHVKEVENGTIFLPDNLSCYLSRLQQNNFEDALYDYRFKYACR